MSQIYKKNTFQLLLDGISSIWYGDFNWGYRGIKVTGKPLFDIIYFHQVSVSTGKLGY